MQSDTVLSGTVFLGSGLEPRKADIIIEHGIIRAIEENPHVPLRWILPAFFNAHTHLGDTVAMDCRADGDLASLVTPPHGLKHRILAVTPEAILVDAMRSSIRLMQRCGTAGFADFREGGPEGVAALRKAASGNPVMPFIFGRDGGELTADGLGVSSARDLPELESQVARARREGKRIAFHAGERDSLDIDEALAFDPDLLIHMTHATSDQIRTCADRNIPIVVCPRSNWILGVSGSADCPSLQKMYDVGCTVYLGTDNVMFVSPDLFSEMAFTSLVYHIPARELLCSAAGGAALAGRSYFIEPGARAAVMVFDPVRAGMQFSQNPLESIVKRANCGMIEKNVLNLSLK